jgi:O-antigen/teichoic acid export membrane protein
MHSRSFLTHAAVYAVGEILGLAGAFLLLPLYTRRLTQAEFGSLEMGERVTEILTMCILVRGVTLAFFVFYKQGKTEAERRRVVGSALLLVTLALLLGGATMLLAAAPLSAGLGLDNPRVLQVYALVGLLDMFTGLGQGASQARQESVPYVALSLMQFLLRVGLCVLFVVVFAWGLWGVLLASLLRSAFFACVLTAREVRRGISWPDRRMAVDMVRFAWPFLAGGLCGFILNSGDRFFLLRWGGQAEVGVYGLGYRLATVVGVFSLTPLYRVWSARMHDVAERPDAPLVFGQVFTRVLAAYLGVGLALCLFQDEIITLFAGLHYAGAAQVLAPVVLAYWFQAAAVLMDSAFYVRRRTTPKLWVTLAATAVMLLLYALLIPPYGAVGAAWATLGGFAFLAGLTRVVSQRLFPVRYEMQRLAAMLALAVVSWLVSRLVPPDAWAVPVKASLWALWLLGLWLGGAITPEEKQWVAQACFRFAPGLPAPRINPQARDLST